MKKSKNPIYVRYEFSDENGNPEGGDVFEFSSMKGVLEMTTDILKVANSDGIAVNLSIGEEKPFFGFLKKVGMDRKAVEKEMVALDLVSAPAPEKSAKKKVKTQPKAKTKTKTKVKSKKSKLA